MSLLEEEYIDYLNEKGILPRLLDILKQLVNIDPPPADPLMYIMHVLGCPLIPQAQMKALERKVSRAHDEMRYLRRLLIDLEGFDHLYDSESDLEEYVGDVLNTGGSQTSLCFEATISYTPIDQAPYIADVTGVITPIPNPKGTSQGSS
ncbi:hypothetical protein KR074_012372, partial [Drosophila pseudoananassae]